MQEHPFVFCGGLLFIFGVRIWLFAVFFFGVSRLLSPGLLSVALEGVFVPREVWAVGGAWLQDSPWQ